MYLKYPFWGAPVSPLVFTQIKGRIVSIPFNLNSSGFYNSCSFRDENGEVNTINFKFSLLTGTGKLCFLPENGEKKVEKLQNGMVELGWWGCSLNRNVWCHMGQNLDFKILECSDT